jgi:endonuclease YncB( thermonuclease family)
MRGAEFPFSSPFIRRSSRFPPAAPTILVLLCAGALVLAAPARAAELRGKVVGVSDGDTITVLDAARTTHKVRLAGIDAPESGQAYGARSKQQLSALVYGKPVIVIWHRRDRYKRIIGQVLQPAPGECAPAGEECVKDVGLALIESGLAWHYRRFQNEQTASDRERYARAEQTARARREGLWKESSPVPPWEYRARPSALGPIERRIAASER